MFRSTFTRFTSCFGSVDAPWLTLYTHWPRSITEDKSALYLDWTANPPRKHRVSIFKWQPVIKMQSHSFSFQSKLQPARSGLEYWSPRIGVQPFQEGLDGRQDPPPIGRRTLQAVQEGKKPHFAEHENFTCIVLCMHGPENFCWSRFSFQRHSVTALNFIYQSSIIYQFHTLIIIIQVSHKWSTRLFRLILL